MSAPTPDRPPPVNPGLTGPWPCFWLEPSGLVALGLRRYTPLRGGPAGWSCDAGWHQGFAWRGRDAPERRAGRRGRPAAQPVPRDDPAWPFTCGRGCGYTFRPGDTWQAWEEPVYLGLPPGRATPARVVLHDGWPPPPATQTAGPGAMRDGAGWLPEAWHGPDGIALIVRCPAPGLDRSNDWIVDAPATSGGQWTRTGDPRNPPTLTVTPSVAIGDPARPGYWHGFLTAGHLA